MTVENKESLSIIVVVFALFLIVGAIVCLIHHGNKCEEYTYQLNEIDDGVYAVYYNTHSTIPAHNYEVVTVCCNGNVYTFNGNVNISFTNDEPYIKVKDRNIVNGDDIYVYVPQGTVVYQPSVDISR